MAAHVSPGRTCSRLLVPAATTVALALAAPSIAWAADAVVNPPADAASEQGQAAAAAGAANAASASAASNASEQGQDASAAGADNAAEQGQDASAAGADNAAEQGQDASAAGADNASEQGKSSSAGAGEGNPGNSNPGNGNPGNGNPGNSNPGNGNPGDGNPGNSNPGNGNPGNGNPGNSNGNPGDGNEAPAAGDPAGNNGTIKIDGVPIDGSRGNEPHVGCAFAVSFFNFDEGQTANITFTGKPPSGPDGVLLSRSGVLISDDPADGSIDAVLHFTAEQLGLTGTAPHRQGWHVKVAVDVIEAPGGSKQKVFWIDCDTTPPGETPPGGGGETPPGGGGETPPVTAPGGGTVVTPPVTPPGGGGETPPGTAPGGGTVVTPPTGTGPDTVVVPPVVTPPSGGNTVVTPPSGVGAEIVEVAPAGEVAAVSAARPGVLGGLPTTGYDVVALVLMGLAAIGIGGAGVAAGRQARTLA